MGIILLTAIHKMKTTTINESITTSYLELTELWHEGEYLKVGDAIRNEMWEASRVAEFCAYFSKYVGSKELEVLHRFI